MTELAVAAASRGARDRNEDCCVGDAGAGVFAVADGVGGRPGGAVASRLAVDRVRAAWAELGGSAWPALPGERHGALAAVRRGVLAADAAVRAGAGPDGMRTTLTGFVVIGDTAVFAHVGDTRAYRIRDREAVQLTCDHDAAAAGGEAARATGVVTSLLGTAGALRVAVFPMTLCRGDRLLLCTDGVHAAAGSGEIARAACAEDLDGAAAACVALAGAGLDDATAVVVEVTAGGAAAERDRRERVIAASAFGALPMWARLRLAGMAMWQQVGAGDALAPVGWGDRLCYVAAAGDAEGVEQTGGLVYPQALLAGTAAPAPAKWARARAPALVAALRCGDVLDLLDSNPDLGVDLYDALGRIFGRRR